MTVVFTPNHFQLCKKVTWDDVILKLSNEIENNTYGITITNNNKFPSIRLPNQFHPKSITEAFNEVKKEKDVKILHVYLSFSGECGTFGRHKDSCDVFIVQSIGEVSYSFDDGSTYKLTPGDSIYIPNGVYHDPIIHSPRVTLSFSWK
jgi:ribosomal protein L16 Arg81 hydroxylase